MNKNLSSTPAVKDPPESQSNTPNQSHPQSAVTSNNGSEKDMSLLQQFRARRRKWVNKRGKRILRALFSFLGKQSLVGDPTVFDASQFPWAMELEKNFDVIHRELQGILTMRKYIPCIHEVSPYEQKISKGDNWRTFFLMGFGYEAKQSWKRCPETMKVLSKIPNLRTAFFSILGPNSHIPHHRGISKGLIRCHLGLIVPDQPDQCVMRVGTQIIQWEEGRCVVFDDTNDHEVWNKTDQERIVLLIDVDRPMKLIGRIISRILTFGVQRSGYVQETRKNLEAWEALYDQAESERIAASMNNPTSPLLRP